MADRWLFNKLQHPSISRKKESMGTFPPFPLHSPSSPSLPLSPSISSFCPLSPLSTSSLSPPYPHPRIPSNSMSLSPHSMSLGKSQPGRNDKFCQIDRNDKIADSLKMGGRLLEGGERRGGRDSGLVTYGSRKRRMYGSEGGEGEGEREGGEGGNVWKRGRGRRREGEGEGEGERKRMMVSGSNPGDGEGGYKRGEEMREGEKGEREIGGRSLEKVGNHSFGSFENAKIQTPFVSPFGNSLDLPFLDPRFLKPILESSKKTKQFFSNIDFGVNPKSDFTKSQNPKFEFPGNDFLEIGSPKFEFPKNYTFPKNYDDPKTFPSENSKSSREIPVTRVFPELFPKGEEEKDKKNEEKDKKEETDMKKKGDDNGSKKLDRREREREREEEEERVREEMVEREGVKGGSEGSESQSESAKCPRYGQASVCGRGQEMEDEIHVEPGFVVLQPLEGVEGEEGGETEGGRREERERGKEALGEYHFFGVYDGHGSSQVSKFCSEHLHFVLSEELCRSPAPNFSRLGFDFFMKNALRQSFLRVDQEVGTRNLCDFHDCRCDFFKKSMCENNMEERREGEGREEDSGERVGRGEQGEREEKGEKILRISGSTAVVVLIGRNRIFVSNCGDSRVVLCRSGIAIPLSSDHKPERPDEKRRIEASGGRIINFGVCRVLGILSMSRAIGDKYLRPFVIADPEITCTERDEKDDFVIIATDGLWDVVQNQRACDVVSRCFTLEKSTVNKMKLSKTDFAATVLVKLAVTRGSTDDVSVIVVDLKNN